MIRTLVPPLLFVFASLDFLDDLVAQRQVNHSTVAIQELMHTVGVLDPSDGRTASVVDVIGPLRRTERCSDEPRCYRESSAA